MSKNWADIAQRPVGIAPLVVLRMVFGLLMAFSTVRFMARGWIRTLYVDPSFHFTYAGFGWVKPLPEAGLWAVFIALTILALLIALGLAYRFSMAGFFVLFTYVELLDKATYLNHYYFVSLFSFLLIFLPLNGHLALDNWLGVAPRRTAVPAWMMGAVRLQIAVVYFFAGVAKLNPDWLLAAQPLTIWLHARSGLPLIGPLLLVPGLPYLMSWGGMMFDLTIPVWLTWPKSRPWAYGLVIFFHGMTALLFNIGIFPWLMIGCTLVFFEWGWLNDRLKGVGPAAEGNKIGRFPPLAPFVALFLLVQLFLPLRHWLLPGDVNWTEAGGRFAWRVMIAEKTGHVTYFVRDPATGREWLVLPGPYLTDLQESQMSFQPDMIMEFARYLATQYEQPVEIRAEAYVSWNGRSSRLLLDPTVNLLTQTSPPILIDPTPTLTP